MKIEDIVSMVVIVAMVVLAGLLVIAMVETMVGSSGIVPDFFKQLFEKLITELSSQISGT